jgi:hypothetical protein
MSNAAEASGLRLVGCTVVEDAFVCPTGGGFENETWRVQANDDWWTVAELLRRGPAGDVTAELVDGHDPNSRKSFGTLPPQNSFHRRTYVVAPIGTQFWRRIIRPVIDRTKTMNDYLLAGNISVTRKAFDDYFVLRGAERLVSLAIDAERRSRPKGPASEPLSKEQSRQYANVLLAVLNGSAR